MSKQWNWTISSALRYNRCDRTWNKRHSGWNNNFHDCNKKNSPKKNNCKWCDGSTINWSRNLMSLRTVKLPVTFLKLTARTKRLSLWTTCEPKRRNNPGGKLKRESVTNSHSKNCMNSSLKSTSSPLKSSKRTSWSNNKPANWTKRHCKSTLSKRPSFKKTTLSSNWCSNWLKWAERTIPKTPLYKHPKTPLYKHRKSKPSHSSKKTKSSCL